MGLPELKEFVVTKYMPVCMSPCLYAALERQSIQSFFFSKLAINTSTPRLGIHAFFFTLISLTIIIVFGNVKLGFKAPIVRRRTRAYCSGLRNGKDGRREWDRVGTSHTRATRFSNHYTSICRKTNNYYTFIKT